MVLHKHEGVHVEEVPAPQVHVRKVAGRAEREEMTTVKWEAYVPVPDPKVFRPRSFAPFYAEIFAGSLSLVYIGIPEDIEGKIMVMRTSINLIY